MTDSQETVARLPDDVRGEFKEPMGPVFADAERLLDGAGRPLVAVGDVVTYHIARTGVPPDVAVVDGRSEREELDSTMLAGLPDLDREVRVASEAATLSRALVEAMVEAIRNGDESVRITVDGEEDLATLPAVVVAPDGATVVYGQPGEGMVRVDVDSAVRERVRGLLGLLETTEAFWELVDRK